MKERSGEVETALPRRKILLAHVWAMKYLMDLSVIEAMRRGRKDSMFSSIPNQIVIQFLLDRDRSVPRAVVEPNNKIGRAHV